MEPELVFTLINALPMPIWLTWVLAPKTKLARYFADSLWPWMVLAGAYVTLVVVSLTTTGPGGGSFSSLAGVMALFDREWGTLAGWAHYLCFDLFVARWIVRDAPDAGYKLSPILVLTLMLGPAGLLLYSVLRGRLGRPRPDSREGKPLRPSMEITPH